MSSKINLVICGYGVAGQARQRAAENLDSVNLKGIVSRRPGVGNLSWQEVLKDPNIDAVAISTENGDHALRVREALEAKKHVLCDYPLAMSSGEVEQLLAVARAYQLVLHVEHLGLLTKSHLELKQQMKSSGALIKGEYLFQGGWNHKLADISWNGPPVLMAYSRLMQVADLFGGYEIINEKIQSDETSLYIYFHLNFKSGGLLGFTEERKVGLSRRRSLLAECERGNLHWKGNYAGENLFQQDLAWFIDRLQNDRAPYYDEEKMIKVFQSIDPYL